MTVTFSQLMFRKLGYKFETVSVLSEPWDAVSRETIEARENEVVNNNPQYCSLARTGIGNIRMLLAGEVDAGMSPVQNLFPSFI